MYRRAEFFKMHYPLTMHNIEKRIGTIKEKPKRVPDKDAITKKITLGRSFRHKKKRGEVYVLGMDMEYQLTVRKGVPHYKTRDFFTFVFFTKEKVLVVLGRDTVITEAMREVSEMLYGDTQGIRPFGSVTFEKGSLVSIINELKQDDPDSWCDEHSAHHDRRRYQDRKTKTNFSLGDGNCVLEDSEARQEINNATSINPKYRFFKCPKLNGTPYDRPKTLRFNGRRGVVSISVKQDFDDWYRFIYDFLLRRLELS